VCARPVVQAHRQAEHLVEVAVVQRAGPVDADQPGAHHRVEVVGAERALEQCHVGLEFALADQRAAEAVDRHVGQREQVVEADAELRLQLALVVGLQRALVGWQGRPQRVVDQAQRQARIGLAIAQRVELLQRRDALVEHAGTALAVDAFERVTRQRRHDLDALLGQELGQVFLARFEQDRQVAAVDHLQAERARARRQAPEVWVQLGCAAGDVEGLRLARTQHLEHQIDQVSAHLLGAVGAGVDMAVQATLVAAVADVDLQRLEAAPAQRREIGPGQQGQRGVHRRAVG